MKTGTDSAIPIIIEAMPHFSAEADRACCSALVIALLILRLIVFTSVMIPPIVQNRIATIESAILCHRFNLVSMQIP